MVQRKKKLLRTIPALGLAAAMAMTLAPRANASSHREAPSITEDPVADLTDVYAFVSPDDARSTTLVMNVNPFELASGGPNFHKFGDDVLYEFNIDNNGDAVADRQVSVPVQDDVHEPQHVLVQHRIRSRR